MKKILIFAVAFLLIISFSGAQQNPEDASSVIGNQIGVDAEKIPTSQEEINKIRDDYLKKEWGEILSKNKILGPIHNFFSNDKTQVIFLFFFAHSYEISLTFLLIFLLWIFFAVVGKKIFSLTEKYSTWIGIGCAILLAQVRAIKLIVNFFLDLFGKQENWWIRAIIMIIAFGFLAAGIVLSKMLSQYMRKSRERKDKSELKQTKSELKEFTGQIKS